MSRSRGRQGGAARFSGVLVGVLAVAVVAGTVAAYVDFQRKVDDATTAAATDPAASSPAGPSSPTGESDPTGPGDPTDATEEPGPPSTRPGSTDGPADDVVSWWVGDGYTAGTGADRPQTGEACVAARELGWTCHLAAERGTGFLSDGHVFDSSYAALPDRLDELPDASAPDAPDVVVLDAGRNDLGVYSDAAIEQAMADYVRDLRRRYPDATLVAVVPWTLGQEEADPDLHAAVTRVMREADGYVVDPYAEGWAGAGKTDSPDLRSSSGVSDQAGHDLIGRHLARSLRALDLPVPTAG